MASITLTATAQPGLSLVVCRDCLWTPGRPLTDRESDRAAADHRQDCPGHIPATRTTAQIKYARRILTGDY